MNAVRAFGPEIWTVDGPVVVAAGGFHYPTRMVIIRLPDGALFLWSPTQLSDGLRAEVNSLGVVRYLIAPNSLHHTFLGDWQRACPEASIYAPPGLPEKRKDIKFDGELSDTPSTHWAGEIDQVVVRGNIITTEVVFFHRRSRTALFTDLIQHFPPGWFRGWRAAVARLDLMTAAEPSVPRKFRAAFVSRRSGRAAIGRILSWPTEKVLMAHGDPVTGHGRAFLHRAFHWLVEA